MKTRLFVYGTLMRECGNHHRLAGAELLGECTTAPLFKLYDLGGCPAMSEGGSTPIVGELYLVTEAELAACDALEGHPGGLYRRVEIALANGEKAQAYVIPEIRIKARSPQMNVPIFSGSWRRHCKMRELVRLANSSAHERQN